MKVLDFYRSYIFFEMDWEKHPPKTISDTRQNVHNRSRIVIECRCEITDTHGKSVEYFLGEATKTERIGADQKLGIFTEPNAEFRPILSEEDSILLKSWDRNDKGVMLQPPTLGQQPERQIISTRDAFHSHKIEVTSAHGILLNSTSDIVQAAQTSRPLLGRTEFTTSGYKVVLDYPIWTMNFSERLGAFQTDTGPVIYPDFSVPHDRVIETFWLAFSAFNQFDWIEFIVQKPTPIRSGLSVNHYSEIVCVENCKNSVIATD